MQNLLLNNFDSYQGAILKSLLAESGFTSIREFQRERHLEADGLFGLVSFNSLYQLVLKPQEIP